MLLSTNTFLEGGLATFDTAREIWIEKDKEKEKKKIYFYQPLLLFEGGLATFDTAGNLRPGPVSLFYTRPNNHL